MRGIPEIISVLSLLAQGFAQWFDPCGTASVLRTQYRLKMVLILPPGWVCGSHVRIPTP